VTAVVARAEQPPIEEKPLIFRSPANSSTLYP